MKYTLFRHTVPTGKTDSFTLVEEESKEVIQRSQQSIPRKPGNGTEEKDPAGKKQDAATKSPQPSSHPDAARTGNVDQPSTTDKAKASQGESGKIWQKALAPETWPSWALVGIGLGGSFLALRSLRALRDQVEANRRSADAAVISANAASLNAQADG